jgi:hypothetical protein
MNSCNKIIHSCVCILFRDLKLISWSRGSLFFFQPVSRFKQNSVWNIYVLHTLQDPRHIFLTRASDLLKCEAAGNLCSLFMEVVVYVFPGIISFIILHRINSNSCYSVSFDVVSGDFFVCIYTCILKE